MEGETSKITVDLTAVNQHERYHQWEYTGSNGRILTLVTLLWQMLLLQIGLFEWTFFLETSLPEQMLLALTDFVGLILIALTELLEQTLLTLIVLLGKISLTQEVWEVSLNKHYYHIWIYMHEH